jgi:putative transposase
VQNAFVESFNGKLRDECLNEHWFTTIRDAREKDKARRVSPAQASSLRT